MVEPKVRMTIVDDTARAKTCAVDCGIDWSQSETVSVARQRVGERFGDRAELEYIELPAAADNESIRKMKAAIVGLPLPVLLANGRPTIAGEFDIRQIMDVIEVNLEAEL